MDLREGFAVLDRDAGAVVEATVAPPAGDLWTRGERWRRRRRRGSVAAAALGAVLLASLSVLWWQRAAPVAPVVSPGSRPTLPDRVYDVSPWLPVGMPREPVVAARLAERRTWTGSVPAIAVITGSGRYLHLGAPDLAGQGAVALSSDGRRLAYWRGGTPNGSPRTSQGRSTPVTGVTVIDLVTGGVDSQHFSTEHGLSPDALLWADQDTLLLAYGQWRAGDDGDPLLHGSAAGGPALRWDVGGSQGPIELSRVPLDGFSESAEGRLLVGRRLHNLATGDVERLPVRSGSGAVGSTGSSAFLRPDGVLAQLGGRGRPDAVPNVVTVSDLDAPAAGQRVVPGVAEAWQVLGWRGGDLLVTHRRSGSRDLPETQPWQLLAVDTTTGESSVVLRGADSLLGWSWAEDLLGNAPVVDAVEPPDPLDPRSVVALATAIVTGTVAGVVIWRRRARP
ncbi:hypothetical protein [Nocardioides sp. SYSU D00065]|uniref:hypothetical protein n=1 Tax=Nocardioides sp. SYSU D00065 TaxID=2817378 RepID=UPI001B33F3D4|nr:hypothetical protein [Nocardioides sp. SYSU D00065]